MRIIFTFAGKQILVDDEDYAELAKYTWRVNARGYAQRTIKERGCQTVIQMHRQILGLHTGDARLVDHINRNKLDNRRSNLRACTKAQNGWNQGPQRTNTTGFKGVNQMPSGRFAAQIRYLGQKHHLGSFDTAEEAHEVYCLAADMLHGEFANHGTKEACHAE
jgi:hypothetical protein